MRSFLCVGFVLFTSLAAQSEDRRTDTSVLNIMTYNAEFLWDGVDPEEGSADFSWKNSQTEADEHMQRVAQVIIQENPDIINMVEVENLESLTRFNDHFLAGRGYRPYFVQGEDTTTGQDVVLLTRIDPEGNHIERDGRQGQSGTTRKSVTKNYYAKFTLGQLRFAMIGLHFLARPDSTERKPQRQAQADAIRNLAVELRTQGFSVIVLGDFNDYDDAVLDHVDSTPITTVLSQIRGMVPGNPQDDLLNLASRIPKQSRYTSFWDKNDNDEIEAPGEYTSIDHILISSDLNSLVDDVRFPHSYDPREVSDHFPIVARFRLSPAGPGQPPVPNPGNGGVRIFSILPNPPGNDNDNEAVTVINNGALAVNVSGWKLRDLAGQNWNLTDLGTLNPGDKKTIKRNGQPMALNNNGDTVDLLDGAGTVRDTVTYPSVLENEVVEH